MPTTEEINKFSIRIENLVEKKKLSYMDAILHYCETTDTEPESIAKLVSGVLKSKIQIEAEELHFIRRSGTGKLPL